MSLMSFLFLITFVHFFVITFVGGCLPRYLVLECVKGVCRQPATYCVNADSRWVGTQVHKCTRVHKCTSTQVHNSTCGGDDAHSSKVVSASELSRGEK